VLGVDDVVAHPEEGEPDENNMHAEDDDGELAPAVAGEERRGGGDEGDEEKKNGVNVGEVHVHVLGVDGDEEVVRPPVGEEEGEGEDIRDEGRPELPDRGPEGLVVEREDGRDLYLEDEEGHDDGKDAVRELVEAGVRHNVS